MVEAVIFDLDGTLLDSEVLWVEALQQAYLRRGCIMSDAEARRLVYGRAWLDIYDDVSREYPGVYASIEELEPVTESIFRELGSSRDIRIHSSIALLRRLAASFPLSIVSGSTRRTIADSIEAMAIDECVRFYIGTEDYSRGKPDPMCFLLAAEAFGVPAPSCLVFEDSAAGVLGAKRAGMMCVGLQREGRPAQDLSAADEVLADLAEFELARYMENAT